MAAGAQSTAGALRVADAVLSISENWFEHNSAGDGGAVSLASSSAEIWDSQFARNTASDEDGAIRSWRSDLTLVRPRFENSIAAAGATAVGFDGGDLKVTGAVLEGNDCSGAGCHVPIPGGGGPRPGCAAPGVSSSLESFSRRRTHGRLEAAEQGSPANP